MAPVNKASLWSGGPHEMEEGPMAPENLGIPMLAAESRKGHGSTAVSRKKVS